MRVHSGTVVSNYKFTDQELDQSTGLYNYDARLYDPLIGRFVNADSMVPDQYSPQSLNRYSYCANNPLIYVDPSGHAHYVLIVGDPGYSGNNFQRAAETTKASLESQGHTASIYSVRSADGFNYAVNKAPEIDGGVYTYGHGGSGSDIVALSMRSGPGTNLDSSTVNQISWGNLGPDAKITLYSCNSGNEEGGVGSSIAQMVANASGKTTTGFTTGLGFSGKEGQYLYGKDAKPPETGPIYMVPVPPGKAQSFDPQTSSSSSTSSFGSWLNDVWGSISDFFGFGEE